MAPLTYYSIEQIIECRCGSFVIRITKCYPSCCHLDKYTCSSLKHTAKHCGCGKLTDSIGVGCGPQVSVYARMFNYFFRFVAISHHQVIDGFQSYFDRNENASRHFVGTRSLRTKSETNCCRFCCCYCSDGSFKMKRRACVVCTFVNMNMQ